MLVDSSSSSDSDTDSNDSMYKSYWDSLVLQNGSDWYDKLIQSTKESKRNKLSIMGHGRSHTLESRHRMSISKQGKRPMNKDRSTPLRWSIGIMLVTRESRSNSGKSGYVVVDIIINNVKYQTYSSITYDTDRLCNDDMYASQYIVQAMNKFIQKYNFKPQHRYSDSSSNDTGTGTGTDSDNVHDSRCKPY